MNQNGVTFWILFGMKEIISKRIPISEIICGKFSPFPAVEKKTQYQDI